MIEIALAVGGFVLLAVGELFVLFVPLVLVAAGVEYGPDRKWTRSLILKVWTVAYVGLGLGGLLIYSGILVWGLV